MKNLRITERERVDTSEMGFRISGRNETPNFYVRMLGAKMGPLQIVPDKRTTTIGITADEGRETQVRELFDSIETGPEEFFFSVTVPYIDEVLLMKKIQREYNDRRNRL